MILLNSLQIHFLFVNKGSFFIGKTNGNRKKARLASLAGAVIQAIGSSEFEDGLRTGVQLEVSNDLQSVRTKPVVNAKSPYGAKLDPGGGVPFGGLLIAGQSARVQQ